MLGTSITSCTDEIMDEINKNPNNPNDVPSRLVITDAMNSSIVSVSNGDYAFYASLFIEHHVGVFNQFYNTEVRNDASVTSATTYNNAWVSSYRTMRNLQDVVDKCSDGGSEAGNFHTLGIAQILMAYNLAVVTDACGDVPWSEALDPINHLRPVLDTQESIYAEVEKLLDEGIANLAKTTTFPALGAQDVIYGLQTNPVDYWTKLGYGLKARYAMRLAHKGKYTYDDVITNVGLSFTSADDEAKYLYNGATSFNPYYLLFTQRDMYGSSKSLDSLNMNEFDPRKAKYFIPHPDNKDTDGNPVFEFAPNGSPDQIQGRYGISSYFNDPVQTTYIMSYHELKFLEAEANERKAAGTGKVIAQAAITAAMTAAKIEQDSITSYLAKVDSIENLNEITFDVKYILKEKYIASFIVEPLEAYADYRRMQSLGESDYIELLNPQTAKFPLRFTYGADDVNNNENVRKAQEKDNGQFVYTDPVWWASPN